jgi:catechol 2,3-dioxygenase-like lactoylglutathione lyase family enzyme
MGRVLGIGGIFYKAKDKKAATRWYRDVLGLDIGDWGTFFPADQAAAHPGAGAVFSIFRPETDYFAPSGRDFMFNFVVDDLDAVLANAAAYGVKAKILPDEPNGRFAHMIDPDGVKVELWQPKPMIV